MNLFLKALEFGVIGLCLITLVIVWKIIKSEQIREAEPRKAILSAAYTFMVFSITLVVINTYIQLTENGHLDKKTVYSKFQIVTIPGASTKSTNLYCPHNSLAKPIGFYMDSEYPVEFSILKDGHWKVRMRNDNFQDNSVTLRLLCE
jgi:hypothetical protein